MALRRNIVANYLGRAYSIAAVYFFIPLYVQILGVDAYGVIAAYTVLLTLAGMADLGLSASFSREAARSSNEKQLLDLLVTIERILLLTAGFIALIIFISADLIVTHWLDHGGEIDLHSIVWSLRLMALMIVPHICVSLYSAGLIGLHKQVKANVIQSLFVTVRSGLVVLPILWQPELPLFFAWQFIATIVFSLFTRAVLVREMGCSGWQTGTFNVNALEANLIFAGGMIWISIISGLNTQIDKILVSKLFSLSDFGYYSLASALAQVPVALATPIAVAFYPFVTKHVANRNKAEERFAYETFGQWTAFMGALGAMGIALFAPQLLELWLHDTNLPPKTAEIASFLAIGSLFLCLGMPSYYLCLAHGQSGMIAKLATGTLLLSIPITLIAVELYGFKGMAFPWVLLNLINFFLITTVAIRQYLGRQYLSRFTRILGLPVVLVLLFLGGAKFVADFVQASSILTGAIAGAGALCAFLVFRALPRSNFVRISAN